MTTEEVIEELEKMYRSDNPVMYGKRGTIKAAIEKLERQKPKEIIHSRTYKNVHDINCPVCNRTLIWGENFKYCPDCGQKLDWSESDEENRNMPDVL